MDNDEQYCHYSDLPSPMAYKNTCMDYDSMGNHGRFPSSKLKKSYMKRFIQKILLWWSFKKPKKENKSIWKL